MLIIFIQVFHFYLCVAFQCLWLHCQLHIVLRFSPDLSKPIQPKPSIAVDSEVYKMLNENQESCEPPRQSASFKVLQEILETGTAFLTPCITILHTSSDSCQFLYTNTLYTADTTFGYASFCNCSFSLNLCTGDSEKPSGFRSVKAPTTKIASSVGTTEKLSICDKCGSGIV